MHVEPLTEQCERGSHAVASATGTLDRHEMTSYGATLATRYEIPNPEISLVSLNHGQRSTTAKYLIVVTKNDR